MKPDNQPRPGELQMKVWLDEEAARRGVHRKTVFLNYQAGKYPARNFRRVNQRVVFVTTEGCQYTP